MYVFFVLADSLFFFLSVTRAASSSSSINKHSAHARPLGRAGGNWVVRCVWRQSKGATPAASAESHECQAVSML
ncbi:uncharacterized protein IWZ02DRAFT_453606 [Phyllosticta citriasiana]|uniref:uncharacterized protein n=1 Tax=Phyllosticta citriasiana TaxID=595635 RepID=UPI0030FDD791